MAGAYLGWSGAVSGVWLAGISTVPDKHPIHEETVCEERLNTMRKPCSQYPTQGKVSMMHMTARASERRAGGNAVCIGKILWSIAGADLCASCPPRDGIREDRGRRETLWGIAVFVLLTCEFLLTEPPPEASSSVAREYMRPEARA